MARVVAGDTQAFGDLVERYKDPLVGYLSRLTADRARAEDLAQEAFLRLFRAADRYQEQGNFAGYLYRTATNLLRSEERRSRRWRWISSCLPVLATWAPDGDRSDSRSDQALFSQELRGQLRLAISRLPLAWRTALVLHDVEGRPLKEVAELLDSREGTIKSRLFRARARLRAELSPYLEGGAR